eukprot:3792513-Prymnesium_polylepis.1
MAAAALRPFVPCALRRMKLRALRAVGVMHDPHLHDAGDPPVRRRPLPVSARYMSLCGSTGCKA